MKLRLEGTRDVLDLNSVFETGAGVQALSGVTGLGLPPVAVQWQEAAGDGAVARGQRVLPRDIDLPLDIVGRDEDHLKALIGTLAQMFADECTLVAIDEQTGEEWYTKVRRVGGGDYVLGKDRTSTPDVQLVVTLRAGDPYFTSTSPVQFLVGDGGTTDPYVSNLAKQPVASSQAVGSITLDNPGDARAYPVWTVTGPGTGFKVTSPTGEVLEWVGTLASGETLVLNTHDGSVRDGTGVNRYSSLAAAPRFWSIPPGRTTAQVYMDAITPASKVVCSFQPRRWIVL